MSLAHLSDEEWLSRLTRSQFDSTLGLPGFPSEHVQSTFVGSSGETALRDAFDFYRIVLNHAGPSVRDVNVLDFGVGWGRIIRLFLRETDPARLFGVDVDPEILRLCAAMRVPGTLSRIAPDGVLPFADDMFGVTYALSVFSHLSEAAAERWLKELTRVTKPGGTLVFTTMDQRFLDLCRGCFQKTENRNQYEEIYARLFADPSLANERFQAGQHVYAPTGGAADVLDPKEYGWAAIPQAWLERALRGTARIDSYDGAGVVRQGVYCLTVT